MYDKHRKRLIKKAKKIYYYNIPFAIKYFNNLKTCSCPMCCNERRNKWLSNREKLTRQERRASDNYKDYNYEY